MKNLPTIKSLVLASALAFSLSAQADDAMSAEKTAPVVGNQGLLGQEFGSLTYSYINLDGSSTHADNYNFSLNQPLAFGLDGILSYDFSQSGEIAGARVKTHTLGAAIKAFSTAYNWGKPYLEVGAGFASSSYPGTKDNSFVWNVGAGVEYHLAPATTLTPYIRYVETPDLVGNGAVNFGVKANHWIDSQWSVTAGFQIDDDQNTAFTVGTNFRF